MSEQWRKVLFSKATCAQMPRQTPIARAIAAVTVKHTVGFTPNLVAKLLLMITLNHLILSTAL